MDCLRPCRSSANGPNPIWCSRRLTTSSAACFSATNSTVRPAVMARAIRLVMVCDLPVPGGPSRTKVWPCSASTIACICEPSAGIGRCRSASSSATPAAAASGEPAGSANRVEPPSTRCLTTGLARNADQLSVRSRHIWKVENCSSRRLARSSSR